MSDNHWSAVRAAIYAGFCLIIGKIHVDNTGVVWVWAPFVLLAVWMLGISARFLLRRA